MENSILNREKVRARIASLDWGKSPLSCGPGHFPVNLMLFQLWVLAPTNLPPQKFPGAQSCGLHVFLCSFGFYSANWFFKVVPPFCFSVATVDSQWLCLSPSVIVSGFLLTLLVGLERMLLTGGH